MSRTVLLRVCQTGFQSHTSAISLIKKYLCPFFGGLFTISPVPYQIIPSEIVTLQCHCYSNGLRYLVDKTMK